MSRKPDSELWTQVRAAIKSPYAWPGGYPIYCYTSDGEMAHPKCVGRNFFRFKASTDRERDDGYRILFVDTYLEGPAETCCICNKACESAYGDPDAEEESK